MVRVTDRVIKLLIDLRQPSKQNPVENMEHHVLVLHKMHECITYVGSSLIFKHLWIWNNVSLNVCNRCASFRWHLSKTSVMSWNCEIWSLQFYQKVSGSPLDIWSCNSWCHWPLSRIALCISSRCLDFWTPCLAASAPETLRISWLQITALHTL